MNRGLTAKGAATRRRIVETTALLIREHGAAETTLEDIRAATGTSKSQLFHYFPEGRTAVLVAVAEYEAAQVLEVQRPYLDDLSTWNSWQIWRKNLLAHYAEFGKLCPLGSLTSELGKTSPETTAVVTEMYDTWEAALLRGVPASTGSALSARKRARSILAAVQGGVMMLRGTGRLDYLEAALDAALEPLRSTTT
ncbi:TetR/AcrR family transcriptional regulator [Saccharopolyspora sp. K220]|uniref:TetR/AcrR family transcriptional regulator n=1 Tax=Saccharopolyspora soli TaxID=2926618 RepID=UPI001F55EF68|nr:TetR/AcrR family transcriptional regulator [Saccharopolyspora soli]MCI2422942.1 TetR/AcrR family transcriptional regulator [Saccharopolyspora soli]